MCASISGVDGVTCAGAGGVVGGEGAIVTGSGLRPEKYTFAEGQKNGTRIGVTHDTFGLCQVISREYTTFPVTSSNSLYESRP